MNYNELIRQTVLHPADIFALDSGHHLLRFFLALVCSTESSLPF